jgi:hypothetical protein
VITRMWEARLVEDARAGDLAAALPGCEVYVSYDGPPRLVVISHWPDEAALSAYAGPSWRTDPAPEATAVGDRLAGTPHVWHFTRLDPVP